MNQVNLLSPIGHQSINSQNGMSISPSSINIPPQSLVLNRLPPPPNGLPNGLANGLPNGLPNGHPNGITIGVTPFNQANTCGAPFNQVAISIAPLNQTNAGGAPLNHNQVNAGGGPLNHNQVNAGGAALNHNQLNAGVTTPNPANSVSFTHLLEDLSTLAGDTGESAGKCVERVCSGTIHFVQNICLPAVPPSARDALLATLIDQLSSLRSAPAGAAPHSQFAACPSSRFSNALAPSSSASNTVRVLACLRLLIPTSFGVPTIVNTYEFWQPVLVPFHCLNGGDLLEVGI